jgi:hypothetical protein
VSRLKTRLKTRPALMPDSTPRQGETRQRRTTDDGSPRTVGNGDTCQREEVTPQHDSAGQNERYMRPPASDPPPDGGSDHAAKGLGHDFGHVLVLSPLSRGVPSALPVSRADDHDEQEADRAAEQVMRAPAPGTSEGRHRPSLSHLAPRLQRAPADETTITPLSETENVLMVPPMTGPASVTTAPAAAGAMTVSGLLVDDEVGELGPGQMRKSAFLDALQNAVCAAADVELAAVGRSSQGCPYVARWMDYYRGRDSQHVEGALLKYAPEARGASAAPDYIPFVSRRVQRAVATWARTGQITDVPAELASQLPGGGVLGAIEGLMSGVAGLASGLMGGVGRAFSGIGKLLFKARPEGARDADPQAIHTQLGTGRGLDGVVKARMESAFGHDFSHVRVHTDATAAALASDLHARAFTIGRDIAFAPQEYRPGTIIGDALLAHELAHVVQQGGAAPSDVPLTKGGTEHSALEEDADASAVGVVASLWGATQGVWSHLTEHTMPSLRSGLKLQRCGRDRAQAPVPKTPTATSPAEGGAPAGGAAGPCGGTALATTFKAEPGGPMPDPDLGPGDFGTTSKLGAYFDFGACKATEAWHFHLTSLRVYVNSAVQPKDFRKNIENAQDPAVTSTEYPQIIRDLRPNANVNFRVSCGADRFIDNVTTYSRRKVYWKHQLTVEHEASHRRDWEKFYRAELIEAEKGIWAHTIPASAANTAKEAIGKEREALTSIMAAAYQRTCKAYTPKQESRAYDEGAPLYQQLVDAITARATKEGWIKSGQTGQQP